MWQSNSHKNYLFILIMVLSALIVPIALGNVVQPRKDFYNEIWAPAYLLVRGDNPYDTSSLNPGLPAIWFPMAKSIFAPLGLINEDFANQLWYFFNVTGLLVIALIAVQNSGSALVAGVVGIFIYLFPPTINHFALGQFSIISTLCSLLAARFVDKKKDWLVAFFLALGSTKPQLMIFPAIGLFYYYYAQFGLWTMSKFILKSILMSLMMCFPLFLAHPTWYQSFFSNIRQNPSWLHPSFFIVLIDYTGVWGYLIWGCAIVAGFFTTIHLWKKVKPVLAMEWALGITTIVTPYIWSWDFVLLLPLWISTFSQSKWKVQIFLIVTYVLGWVGMAFFQIASGGNNRTFWWVPLWYMGNISLATYFNSRQVKPVEKMST